MLVRQILRGCGCQRAITCNIASQRQRLSTMSAGAGSASSFRTFALVGGGATLLAAGLFGGKVPEAEPAVVKDRIISLSEVQADHGEEVWVTYKGGVYNVTAFLDAHPGGPDRIMMVNGNDLHPFWDIYQLHHRPHIKSLLEEFRIGSLSPADRKKSEALSVFTSAYGSDPKRPRAESGEMRVPSYAPFNMEPPPSRLADSFLTPNDLFFVRNHNPVPVIDGQEWALEVVANPKCGMAEDVNFSLDELRSDQERFPRVEIIAALQCAGNRQEEFITEDRPLYVAPHWRGGAIGCARWTGVRVRDVLRAAGMDVDAMSLGRVPYHDRARIVNFIAEDTDETGVPYAGVIPVEKAIDPFGDAILAYEMNGETLPRDHGYPVRLLAPGHAGCRNVKWVRQIEVTMAPSELDSGSKLDRHFAPEVTWEGHREHVAEERAECTADGCRLPGLPSTDEKLDLAKGPVIQTLPVQSIIAKPADRSVLPGS